MACSAAERAEPAVRCQLIPWAYESAAERAEPAVRCQLIPWAYESAAERAEPARTTTTAPAQAVSSGALCASLTPVVTRYSAPCCSSRSVSYTHLTLPTNREV